MRKRSELIKKAILDAAKDLFVVSGYDATTIQNIANKAGVTKRTVYAHYPDKATILKNAIKGLVDSGLEPDLNEAQKIESRDDLYKELYIIAKSLNDTFAQDSYVNLLRIVISEINRHPELGGLSSIGITAYSMRKLVSIFESTNASGLTSIRNTNMGSKMFLGGFLVQFYIDGLLEPSPNKYRKFTSAELFNYVDKFTKVLFRPKSNQNDGILSIKSKGNPYGV